MTIVLHETVAHGAPAAIVNRAQRVEDFCVDMLATRVEVYIEGPDGRFTITSDQSYHETGDIITTIKEIDL